MNLQQHLYNQSLRTRRWAKGENLSWKFDESSVKSKPIKLPETVYDPVAKQSFTFCAYYNCDEVIVLIGTGSNSKAKYCKVHE